MSVLRHARKGPIRLEEQKAPDAIWDVAVAWGTFVGDGSIVNRQWSAVGVTVDAESNAASMTIDGVTFEHVEIARVSGGQIGQLAEVKVQVTLDSGLREECTLLIAVEKQ